MPVQRSSDKALVWYDRGFAQSQASPHLALILSLQGFLIAFLKLIKGLIDLLHSSTDECVSTT
jgi:hypothetical protein